MKIIGQFRYGALSDQGQGHDATLKLFSIYRNTNCQVPYSTLVQSRKLRQSVYV